MRQTPDGRDLPRELLARIAALLACDGITQVTEASGVIYALVDGTTPLLIHFVPNQQTREEEWILQIYFSLAALQTTQTAPLLTRLEELNRRIPLGSLRVLPGREIGYQHRFPVKVSAQEAAIADFQQSLQLMLLFLLGFLPYVRSLSADPESITLARYLTEED